MKSKNLTVLEAVKKILQENQLGTQEELREELAKLDFDVTQSTVSRALKKVGAVRRYKDNNQAYYVLPDDDDLPSVSSTIIDLVQDVSANENLIVVTTKPGSASLIARHIDHDVKTVLGTVAGDDCILVIPESVKAIKYTVQEVNESLGVVS